MSMDEHRLRYLFQVLSELQNANVCLSELVSAVLVHKQFNGPNDRLLQDLVCNSQDVLSAFHEHPATSVATREWAHKQMIKHYTGAVRNLADVDQGWHFGAMHATPEQVRDFRLEDMAVSMRRSGPELWDLVFSLLGGQGSPVNESSCLVLDVDDAQYWIDDEDIEQILGSAGRSDGRGEKRRRDHAGLVQIKAVVVLSIFMHAMDQQCNALQSTMGIFLHSCNAPEKLAKVLSRMGISTSLSSTHRAITSLSQQSHGDIEALGRTLLTSHAFDNFDAQIKTLISTIDKQHDGLLHLTSGTLLRLAHATLDDLRCSDILWDRLELNIHASDPRPFDPRTTMVKLCSLHPEADASLPPSGLTRRGRFRAWFFTRTLLEHGPPSLKSLLNFLPNPEFVDAIPLSKLYQTPLRAMNINQSTVSGNIEALLNMFEQAGLGNPFDSGNTNSMRVDPTEFAILVHGDLGTCERVLSGLRRRSQEWNPYDRLQPVVFISGLFHLKMAAADAIWRALVSPKGARVDDTSFMKLAGELRPNESSRLVNNAKFCQQHELISHVGILLQLDAWRVEIKKRFGHATLEEWAATKPKLGDIQEVAEALALRYVEGEDVDLYAEGRRPESTRDRIQENTMRTLNYLFLYEELSYAMNAGDIGRIETLFPPWIQLFRATGKHKYSHQMLRFAHALYFVYPEGLRCVLSARWST
ncbi:hypothetical protein GSI_14604 [Ganoderma sinense ZZ0214-1]|uniref:DUF6589 domain-containing protein n=1 Tax=Ganoderma sinense ZZ0214-1 TaxID=1077348 RepID=A0A2G8RP42_9APHY|nr:hypothetical protein GSI_14604 [Ganoderma sinense ZZ0214-1]